MQVRLTDHAVTEKNYLTTRAALQALANQGRMEIVAFLTEIGSGLDGRDPVLILADLVKNNIVLVIDDDQVEFQSRAARRFAEIMSSGLGT